MLKDISQTFRTPVGSRRAALGACICETHLFYGGKQGQPHIQPQAAHLAANQPALLTLMTASSWVILKLFGVEDRDFAWLHESPTRWLNNIA